MASCDQDEVLRELRCSTDFVLVRRRRRGRGTHGAKDKKGSPGAPWKERCSQMADRSTAKGKRWRRHRATEGDAADNADLVAGAGSSSERVVVRSPVASTHHPAHRGGEYHCTSSSRSTRILQQPSYSSPSSSRSSSVSPVPSWQPSRAGTDDNNDDDGTTTHVFRASSRAGGDDVVGGVAALIDCHHHQHHHHRDDDLAVDETLPRRCRQKKNRRAPALRMTEVFSSICTTTSFHNPRACQRIRPYLAPNESQNPVPTSGGELHLENEAVPQPIKPCPHFRRCHGAGGAFRPEVLDYSPTRRSAWLEVSGEPIRAGNNSGDSSVQRCSYKTIPVCCSSSSDSKGGGVVNAAARGTSKGGGVVNAAARGTTTTTATTSCSSVSTSPITCDNNARGSEDRHQAFENTARPVPARRGAEGRKQTACSCCNNISKPRRDTHRSVGLSQECLVCDNSHDRTDSQTFVLEEKKKEDQAEERGEEAGQEEGRDGSQETCGSIVTPASPSCPRCSCQQRRTSLPVSAALARQPQRAQTSRDSHNPQQRRGQCCPSHYDAPKRAVTCYSQLDRSTNCVITTTSTCLAVPAPGEAPSSGRPASEPCTPSRWRHWTRMLRMRHVGRCLLLLLLTGLGGLFARVTITDYHAAHGPPGDVMGGIGGGGLEFGGVVHDNKHPVSILMKMHMHRIPLREFHARLRTIRTKFDLLRMFLGTDMTDDSLKELLANTAHVTASSNDAVLAGPRPGVTHRGYVTTTTASDDDDNAPHTVISNPLAEKTDVTPVPKDHVVLAEASTRSDAKLMSSSSTPRELSTFATQTDVTSAKRGTKASKRIDRVLSNSGVEPFFKTSDRPNSGGNSGSKPRLTASPDLGTVQGPNDAVHVKQTTDKSETVRLPPAVDLKQGTLLGDVRYTSVKKREETYEDYEEVNVEDYMDGEVEYYNDDANTDAILEELEAAAYHIADMENNKHAVCKDPKPQVIYIEDPKKQNRLFFPECTVVYRCRNDSGCCGRNYECAPKTKRFIVQSFLAVQVDNRESTVLLDSQMVERIRLENHTECECREKPRLPDCTQDCPGVFQAYRYGWKCVCDCISTPNERFPQCDNVKDGLEPLLPKDLVCIKSGRCGEPICSSGEFDVSTGFCPLSPFYAIPGKFHQEQLRQEHRLRHERKQNHEQRLRHARRKSVPEGSGDF